MWLNVQNLEMWYNCGCVTQQYLLKNLHQFCPTPPVMSLGEIPKQMELIFPIIQSKFFTFFWCLLYFGQFNLQIWPNQALKHKLRSGHHVTMHSITFDVFIIPRTQFLAFWTNYGQFYPMQVWMNGFNQGFLLTPTPKWC